MNLEYELSRTQRILEWILDNNRNVVGPSDSDMNDISNQTILQLQKKYPQAGVKRADRSVGDINAGLGSERHPLPR